MMRAGFFIVNLSFSLEPVHSPHTKLLHARQYYQKYVQLNKPLKLRKGAKMYPCRFHAPKIASQSEFQELLALHQVLSPGNHFLQIVCAGEWQKNMFGIQMACR